VSKRYAFGGAPGYDVRHGITARDGWPLAVYEYRPRGQPADQPPVLLVHGTNARYRIFDNGGGFGLAPYLASQGRHVFALELRGRGASLPRSFGRRVRSLARGWTIDEMREQDLPAAFSLVLRHTGAKQLDYVGHSLGGMLAVEFLACTPDPRVRRLVLLGSGDARALLVPNPRKPGDPRDVKVGMLLAPFALLSPYTPLEWGAKLAALMPLTPRWALTSALHAENFEPAVLRRFLWHGTSGISRRKFWSFGVHYRKERRGTRACVLAQPTLLIAGSNDRTVPALRVREAAARMVQPLVRVVELGTGQGHAVDYGHTDLLLGRHAEREVFPLISTFLSEPG
jgi:lysosomal acid lipase/cholesteryl ester hydrolase